MATGEEGAGNKHFSPKHQDWQPTHGNAEDSEFFFPACIPKFSVFSPPDSLSATPPSDTLPHFLWANTSGTPGHSTVTRISHQDPSACSVQGKNSPWKMPYLKKKKIKNYISTHIWSIDNSALGWISYLKPIWLKGKFFQKLHEKQKEVKKENTFTKEPQKIKTQYKVFLKELLFSSYCLSIFSSKT